MIHSNYFSFVVHTNTCSFGEHQCEQHRKYITHAGSIFDHRTIPVQKGEERGGKLPIPGFVSAVPCVRPPEGEFTRGHEAAREECREKGAICFYVPLINRAASIVHLLANGRHVSQRTRTHAFYSKHPHLFISSRGRKRDSPDSPSRFLLESSRQWRENFFNTHARPIKIYQNYCHPEGRKGETSIGGGKVLSAVISWSVVNCCTCMSNKVTRASK